MSLEANLEFREDRLEERERALDELERRLGDKESELVASVARVQSQLGRRDVAAWNPA